VRLRVRSDNGFAVPGLYDSCEANGLPHAFGHASDPVLQRPTAQAPADLALYYTFDRHREATVQRFESLTNYRADSRPQPRRIVAEIEVTPQGRQRRFVVTNLDEPADVADRDFYVQRGGVPGHPLGERKNGLQADRLSARGFRANAVRLLVPTPACAIVVWSREAVAAVEEGATATASTPRQRLWKVGAVVVTSARRIWVHGSATWPKRGLWGQVQSAGGAFLAQLRRGATAGEPPPAAPPR
jgi:Transposase DDE domain group 1